MTHSPPPPPSFYQQVIAESEVISIFLDVMIRNAEEREQEELGTSQQQEAADSEMLKTLCAFAEHPPNLAQLNDGIFFLLFILYQVMVFGYDCSFEKISDFRSENTMSVGTLLLEFFHFYGFQFDYANQVVSIRLGQDPPPSKNQWKYLFYFF